MCLLRRKHSVCAHQAIAASAQTIPDSMERFNEVYGALTTQVDELEQRLQAFSEMRQQAIDAFPVIQQRITEITDGMAEASTTHSAAVESFTERLNEASAAQQDSTGPIRRHHSCQGVIQFSAFTFAEFYGFT